MELNSHCRDIPEREAFLIALECCKMMFWVEVKCLAHSYLPSSLLNPRHQSPETELAFGSTRVRHSEKRETYVGGSFYLCHGVSLKCLSLCYSNEN